MVLLLGLVCSILFGGSASALALTLQVSAAQTNTPADQKVSAATAPAVIKGTLGLRTAFAILAASKSRMAAGADLKRVDIVLGPGIYRLEQSLHVTLDASWRGTPITVSGAGEKQTILSGSRLVHNFKPAQGDAAARLPAAARGHVLVASLADSGISDAGQFVRHGFGIGAQPAALELFYRGQPATLARWPDTGFATIASLPDGPKGLRFVVAGAPLAALKNEPDLRAMGYWARDWADTTLSVAAVDPASDTVTLKAPAPILGLKAGQRMFFENALSQLDRPGEWYLDRQHMQLYFWPPAPLHDDDVEASVAGTLLALDNVTNLTFRKLSLENARGNALKINGGSNIVVEHASVRNVGDAAVWSTASNSHFRFMDVENSGEGGFAIYAGNRLTLAPGNTSVEDSMIHDYARRTRAYRPAIGISGVGDRIERNHIYNGPHAAIIFNGNNHVIAGNEIDHVALEVDDTGAIYSGRDWTARGTVIEDNFLHDIGSADKPHATMGVYLDDQLSGTTIRRNIFSKVNQAVFIGGGRDNVVEDNLFVNCTPAIYLDSRGLSWEKAMSDNPNGQLQRQLVTIKYRQQPYSTRYPTLATLLEDEPGAPKGNVLRRNLVIAGQATAIDTRASPYVKIEQAFGAVDAAFIKPMPDTARSTLEDLQLAPSAPALRQGFKVSAFKRTPK